MTDIERQLHVALREAVPDREVPHRLVPAAARRATTIRRRRATARGALGAAGIVAGGALLSAAAKTPGSARLEPASRPPSTSPTAPPPSEVRLTLGGSCLPEETSATGRCDRVTVEVGPPKWRRQWFLVATKSGTWASAADPVSLRVVVEQPDGSERVEIARPDGENRWVFDIEVPDSAGLDVADANGSLELRFSQPL